MFDGIIVLNTSYHYNIDDEDEEMPSSGAFDRNLKKNMVGIYRKEIHAKVSLPLRGATRGHLIL